MLLLAIAMLSAGTVNDNRQKIFDIDSDAYRAVKTLYISHGYALPSTSGPWSGAELEMMVISVSAVLAGAVCGDHISPISDTTVMSSAGAQSNHINHVSTQMQYAAVVAAVCLVGYVIAGIVHVWWIVLGISLILLVGVLTVIRKVTKQER